ncbi:hypothetical protein L227DRAFT_474990, partial [Lentinus tigrinus ALCF2SS1-6]
IYLAGVLPGPKAPSLQEVNHYIAPLVPELLELWDNGVAYTRTALHPDGRLTRGLLVPVVADLGAVRKTTGYGSHSATYFCSFCQLKKGDINQTDPTKWPRRDCETFRRLSKAWYGARSVKEREKLFKAHGVRYSVLLELPYWKPTRYVVLDTMHNLFLGLFQRHCRKVFGMNIAVDEGTIQSEDVEVSEEDLAAAIHELRKRENAHSLKAHLTLPTMRALYEASQLGDPGKRNKLQMAQELLAQVLHKDMALTSLPTSIGRVPINVGAAAAGTLSADQWRTLSTVHLPITLVRLWANLPAVERKRKMLDNFLHMVAAVRYGTARRVSNIRVQTYNYHIFSYVRGLRDLFPEQELVPNQHLALHLGEVLSRFGPTQGYWAFPFERYIRLLRQGGINYRIG